jgi:hypothetical protein
MRTCFPAVSLHESGDPPIVRGIVCPDHEMGVLSPSHRLYFASHSTGIQAKWLITPLTDHIIDMD